MNSSKINFSGLSRKLFLTLWILFVSFPIYWTLITSLKLPIDIFQGPVFVPWVDFQPTFEAWSSLLYGSDSEGFWHNFWNSIVIGVISSIAALVIGAMAAYGLSRYKYKYGTMRNDDLAFLVLSQRMMPPIVAVIAIFIMFKSVGLLDSKLGMIIIYTWFNIPITLFLLKDYFSGISVDLEHAAAIDGYSKWDQIRKIVLPLAKPGLAAAFLLSFIFAWNEFLVALTMTFQKSQTLPIFIAGLSAREQPLWSVISAAGVFAMLQPILIAAVLDKYIVSGLMSRVQK